MATYYITSAFPANNYLSPSVPFPALDPSHIKVKRKLAGESTYTELTYRTETAWQSLVSISQTGYPNDPNSYRVVLQGTTNVIQISRRYGGETWIVYRVTPREDTLFTNSSALTAEDLNLAFRKVSYLAEERDQIDIISSNTNFDAKYDKTGGTITGDVSISGSASVGSTLTLNNNKITGVATPTESNDVATKAYVDLANSPGGVPTILPNSITSTELSKTGGSEAVTTATIRNLAVTASKIANLTITNDKIAEATIASDKLVSPLTATIGENVISCTDEGTLNPLYAPVEENEGSETDLRRVVSTNAIRIKAVTTSRLADSSVTPVKLATDAVTTSKIVNGNVTGEKIAPTTITSNKLLTTGFSFDSTGNVNATSLVSSGNIQTSGIVRKPNPTSETFSQPWSAVDPNGNYLLTGFNILYKPATFNNPNSVPVPTLSYNNSLYPYRIVFTRAYWEYPNTPAPLTIVGRQWSRKLFNTIIYNNTNFFGLNSTNGEFIIDGANNPSARGFWKFTSNFIVTDEFTTGYNVYVASRLRGHGWNRVWEEYPDVERRDNPENLSPDAVLFYGPYIIQEARSPTAVQVRLEGVFEVGSFTTAPFFVEVFARISVSSISNFVDGPSDLYDGPSPAVNGFGSGFAFGSANDFRANLGICELVKIA